MDEVFDRVVVFGPITYFCKECGKPFHPKRMGPRPKFCCDRHRKRYGARKARAAARDPSNYWVPEEIRARVRAEHPITLDTAAESRSTWVRGNWFGPEHPDPARRDALLWDWSQVAGGGWVWSCPPFKPWQTMERFVRRCVETAERGTGVAALLQYHPGAQWYRKWITDCRTVRVTEQPLYERIRFEGPRATGKPAGFDVVLVCWEPADQPRLSLWPWTLFPRPESRGPRLLPGDLVLRWSSTATASTRSARAARRPVPEVLTVRSSPEFWLA